MFKVRGDVEKVSQVLDSLAEIEYYRIPKHMRAWGHEIRQGVQKNLTMEDAIFKGRLYRSFVVSPVTKKVDGFEVRTYSVMKYASSVEFGTRPFWPPQRPLEDWVRKKLRVSWNRVRSVAFLVRRKIARTGIRGRFFMGRAVDEFKLKLPIALKELFKIEVK